MNTMTTPQQALARIIDTCQPATLVVCGTVAGEVGEHWCRHHDESAMTTLDTNAPNEAFPLPETQDLALVTNTLEHLSHEQGKVLLGQLRNYGTHQIAVVVADNPDWSFKDFIGLGFRRQAELVEESTPLTLYTYNINSYNHKRAWNNPDNWANPEMWDKARW